MPYINVDEVYILDNTGLQVDQVTDLPYTNAGLTESQQAQARKNIAAGGTNPNLLDNPFFTINQRGQASYTGAAFGVDRWTMAGASGSVVVNSGYLTISNVAGSPYLQRLGRELKLGKTYTASILLNDGTVNSVTFTTSTQKEYVYQLGNYYFELDARSAYAPNYRFMIYGNSTWTMDIVAAKLELGSVSTLANDTPPDYGTELIKCRGYFERIHSLGSSEIVGMGMGVSASSVRIGIPSLICHTIQSVTYSGGGLLLEGGGNYRALTSIGKLNATPKNGFLTVTCGSSDAITLYQTYALVGTAAGGYIDISADL